VERSRAALAVGIVGGMMLGLGRALGETMGDIRNRQCTPHQFLVVGSGHHISSAIANEFTEAVAISIPRR